jgi:hypothetical protein
MLVGTRTASRSRSKGVGRYGSTTRPRRKTGAPARDSDDMRAVLALLGPDIQNSSRGERKERLHCPERASEAVRTACAQRHPRHGGSTQGIEGEEVQGGEKGVQGPWRS